MKRKLLFATILLSLLVGGNFYLGRLDSSFPWYAMQASLTDFEMSIVNQWRTNGGLRYEIEPGDSGQSVRILQYTLSRSGADVYPADLITGFYGERTTEGVYKWQELNGIKPTGRVNQETLNKINEIYFKEMCPTPLGEYEDHLLSPVGKNYMLPYGYVPKNLVDITEMVKVLGPVCMEKEAADKLIEMFKKAEEEGVVLAVSSGFRRYEIQDMIHQSYLRTRGAVAFDFSAKPGHSEHHLGTAVDLTGRSIDFKAVSLSFANTKEKEWLRNNAHKYGFALSYPENGKEVTGYVYEPWHWRYIGVEMAKEFSNSNMFLVEFLTRKSGKKQDNLDRLLMRIDNFLLKTSF